MPINIKEIVQTTIIDSNTPESITNQEVGDILNQIVELTNVPNGALVIIYKGKQNDIPNTGNALQVNDYVRGQLPGGPYWDKAIYNGGSPTSVDSYTMISVQGPTGPQGPAGQDAVFGAKTRGDKVGSPISAPTNYTVLSDDINNLVITVNGETHYTLPTTTTFGKEVIVINDSVYISEIHSISPVIIRLNYPVELNNQPSMSTSTYVHSGKSFKFTYLKDNTWFMEEYYTPCIPEAIITTPGESTPSYNIPVAGGIYGSCVVSCTPTNAINSYIKLRENPLDNGYRVTDSITVCNASKTENLNLINSNLYHNYLLQLPNNTPYVIPPMGVARFTLGPNSFYWIAEKLIY